MADTSQAGLAPKKDSGFQVTSSRNFYAFLAEQNIALAMTTYQTGRLILIGRKPDGRLAVVERPFLRSMALSGDARTLWMGSLQQLYRFENVLRPGMPHKDYDALFVPSIAYTTGDLDIHDIGVDSTGRLIFVNTLFSCIATLSVRDSFVPLWKPAFVSKFAAEDRCHLNGMAMQDGKVRYVTICGKSDIVDGWREHQRNGGCVIDVATNAIVATGLSMPHTPRLYRDKLYVHNSGTGYFGTVDVKSGKFEPIAFAPGYLRGLAFAGDFAIVGLSKARSGQNFGGLDLDAALAEKNVKAWCGLLVIDLRSGDALHWARIEGTVEELYDVVALPGIVQPALIGLQTEEIRRVVSIGEAGTL
jgi:uncharacterized protein (TIGR03032 family)